MSFDCDMYGAIPPNARSLNEAVCVSGRFDDQNKHFGMVRRSTVLSSVARIGVSTPTKTQMDFAAALIAFTAFGLAEAHALARAKAGRYTVQWFGSAKEALDRVPDETWDVAIAIIVFAREW
jgi:hypothetical protein